MKYSTLNLNERRTFRTFLQQNKDIYRPLTSLKINARLKNRPSDRKRRASNTLPNGYTVDQEWNGLRDCWLGFKISKNNDDVKTQQWYAAGIQRFCNDLGLFVPSFPELKMAALSFYKDNAEWLPSDISGQEIFEIMLKNDFDYLRKRAEEQDGNN